MITHTKLGAKGVQIFYLRANFGLICLTQSSDGFCIRLSFANPKFAQLTQSMENGCHVDISRNRISVRNFLTPFFASMLTLTREPGCVGGRRRRWCPQCEQRAAGHTRPGRAGGEGFLGHRGLVCSAGGRWEWG